jgi:hypothetical protein
VRPGYERIPYGQFNKNWRKWEREKHWDRQVRGYGHERERRDRHEGRDLRREERREDRTDNRGHREDRGMERHRRD